MLALDRCARVKRITLSIEEQTAFLERAVGHVARCGLFTSSAEVRPLAVSDQTQTYRVSDSQHTAVLKLLPPAVADVTLRVHRFFTRQAISLARIVWADVDAGAVLYEDLGTQGGASRRNPSELSELVRYLACLHDVSMMDHRTARREFPTLAADGFPSRSDLAAMIVGRYGAVERSVRSRVIDLAADLVEDAPPLPFLTVSDIKREHFFFGRHGPILVDLELASFWDLPAANLATLLGFPGQFDSSLDSTMKRSLVDEYVRARRGQTLDPVRFYRGVEAAEFLLSLTVSSAVAHCRRQTGYIVRHRTLTAGDTGRQSVEAEIGAEKFRRLRQKLDESPPLRILDVASGEGLTGGEIAKGWPRHRVTTLDLHPPAVTLPAVRGDARCLPFVTGTFDIVLCVQLLQYIPDKLHVLAEVYRILKPEGTAWFAMTEHFGGQFSLVPDLAEIAAAAEPSGVVHGIETRTVGGRSVSAFTMAGRSGELKWPCQFVTAVASRADESIDCYYQSHYAWTR
jgi:SAM-dependent methyltransferase